MKTHTRACLHMCVCVGGVFTCVGVGCVGSHADVHTYMHVRYRVSKHANYLRRLGFFISALGSHQISLIWLD
jgi:hypothetical protein